MKTRIILALAVCAGLAAPAGSATWMSYGSYEPDTVHDTTAFNFADPPPSGSNRIYFNAYATSSTVAGSGVNPNVGAAQSHIEPAGVEQVWAVFGVWRDCNGDGYVGHVESAFREYPSAILLDDSECPAITLPTTGSCRAASCADWPVGYHNVNGWVTELIPVANGELTAGDDRVFYDQTAAVWGDFGRPGDQPRGTCAINPLPRGTLHTVGGMLTYMDCRMDASGAPMLETWNTVMETAGDPAGLTFADPDDGESNPIGLTETFGDDHSDNAIVHAGDCSDPDAFLVEWADTPLGGPLAGNLGEGIRNPDPTYIHPEGNVAGTVNYTREALPLPDVQTDDETGPDSTSNCDFEDDRGADIYNQVEGDFTSGSDVARAEADWNFGFTTMSRSGAPLAVPFGFLGPAGFSGGVAGGAPSDAGLEPFNAVCLICQQSEWFGGSSLIKGGFQTVAVRADLDDPGADVADPWWLSFYAYVSPTFAARFQTPGGAGIYAFEACGETRVGIQNFWNCDPDEWNLNPSGEALPDPYGTFAKPGKAYTHRDIDCYDGTIGAAAGVGIQPASLGESPCAVG